MADEVTDSSKKEQLVVYFCWVDMILSPEKTLLDFTMLNPSKLTFWLHASKIVCYTRTLV